MNTETDPDQTPVEAESETGENTGETGNKKFKFEKLTFLLFAVIIIEGYVVLSTELLAIRQVVPFVGSGTDTISIIIAAVLMPLAFGYYAGGRFRPGFNKKGKYVSIRKKLVLNILIASAILLVGLSYPLLQDFFVHLIKHVADHRLFLTTAYSLLFLVVPVYLLGQTIPLVSNYFSKERLSKITGHMLFFSTLGSFLGAVFSTIVLMSTIGVHYTVALNFVLLAVLVALLSKNKLTERALIAYTIAAIGLFLNSGSVMREYNIVENNQYNTISVKVKPSGTRVLSLNNNLSSSLSPTGRRFAYIELAEKIALHPIAFSNPPKKVLVIGAGAFTFGLDDETNIIHYVDIDKSLRGIAEKHILQRELTDNKEFFAVPARAFLTKSEEKYDVILLDAFLGASTIPEHLVTVEFFDQVRQHLNEEGVVLMNFIISPSFRSRFSRHIDTTIRQIFPFISRTVVNNQYGLWSDDESKQANVMYIYRHNADDDITEIYTDNRNRVFFDKKQQR